MVNLLTALTGDQISHQNSPIDNNGWDEDPDSSYSISNNLYSTHFFSAAYNLEAITIHAYSYGNSNKHDGSFTAVSYVQYTLNGTDWLLFDVPEGTLWSDTSRGGRGDLKITLDQVLYTVDVKDVLGIRYRGYTTDFPDQKTQTLWQLEAYANIGGGYSCII